MRWKKFFSFQNCLVFDAYLFARKINHFKVGPISVKKFNSLAAVNAPSGNLNPTNNYLTKLVVSTVSRLISTDLYIQLNNTKGIPEILRKQTGII